MAGEEQANITRTHTATVVPPRDTLEIAVRLSDWSRLIRKVRRISAGFSKCELLAGVAFGTTVSSAFALISIYMPKEPPALKPWVEPFCWVVLVGSLILGGTFMAWGRDSAKNVEATLNELLSEMTEIYSCPEDPPESPSTWAKFVNWLRSPI